MKDRCYKNSCLKHKLFQMRNDKKKNPKWKLSDEQLEFVEKFFPVRPYLYRITTQPIQNVSKQCAILKQVHFECVRNHKKYIYKTLSKKELAALRSKGIEVIVFKYEILLNGYS